MKHITQSSANTLSVKKKRHHWLVVLVLSQVLFNAGIIVGALALFLINRFVPDQSDGVRFVMDTYFPFLGALLILPCYCAIFDRELFRRMLPGRKGFARGNNTKMLLWGYLSGFAANALCIAGAWLHGDVQFSMAKISLPFLLFAFLIVMVQSGAEEVTYRGYMHFALEERYGVRPAIVINGLIFGLMHLANDGSTVLSCLNIALIGIVYSLCLYYFDSLWFCIANHTAWNFTQNFLFGLPNSGYASEKSFLILNNSRSSLFYDEVFGVEGTATLLVLLLLVIGGMMICIAKRNRSGKSAGKLL